MMPKKKQAKRKTSHKAKNVGRGEDIADKKGARLTN
jgi:hypothetical protein